MVKPSRAAFVVAAVASVCCLLPIAAGPAAAGAARHPVVGTSGASTQRPTVHGHMAPADAPWCC